MAVPHQIRSAVGAALVAPRPARSAPARTLIPVLLEPIVLAPGDGARYCVTTALVSADPPTRFFGVGQSGDVLLGELFVLTPEVPFVAYVDRFAAWHDLALLWAGWRIFCYLCGRPDPAPPSDLPRWRADWFAPLAALPIAAYQVGDRTIFVRRSGPRAYAATIADRTGRVCGAADGSVSVAAAVEAAERRMQDDAAMIPS